MGPCQQQQPVSMKGVGSIPETAVLTVESMQAAISTAAALAAAGAVISPQNQIMCAAAPMPSSGSIQPRIALAPALGATLATPYSSTRSVAPMLSLQPTSIASQKSLYAGYTISQQTVAPLLAPLLFPTSAAHVIPHNQQPTTTATHTKTGQQPSIFDKMKLRRGKWTVEEEAYAGLSIAEFEKGTVEGCENGCTLRSFLSKKLHCAPMRISKKYAGKSIGKHVFLSRSTVNEIVKPDSGGPNNKATLKELEIKFYKSLFRETEANMMVSPYVHHFNPVMHAGHQMMSPSVNPYAPAPSYIPYTSQGQTAQPSMPWPTMPVGPANEQEQRAQLHQTFMTVLNQTPLTPAPHHGTSTIQAIQMHPAPIAPAPLVAPRMPAAPNTVASNPMAGAPLATRVPTPALSQVQRASSQQVVQQPAHQVQGSQPPSQAPMHVQVTTQLGGPHYQEISAGTMDLLPDFLSGFDKVAARSGVSQPAFHAAPVTNGRQSSQYSPPFTSRSFDDFHQLLGKGLSPRPLDLNNAYRGFPQPPFDTNSQPNPTHAADTEPGQPHVTADSYALFAQQSALAVSQHSAYCSKGNPTSIQLPNLSANANIQRGLPSTTFVPSVVNAANLRAHSEAQRAAKSAVVSGSEKSEWGTSTEESESTGVLSRESGSESNTGSDDASDNASNDSDSISVEGPQKKKMKVGHDGQRQPQRAQIFRPTAGQ